MGGRAGRGHILHVSFGLRVCTCCRRAQATELLREWRAQAALTAHVSREIALTRHDGASVIQVLRRCATQFVSHSFELEQELLAHTSRRPAAYTVAAAAPGIATGDIDARARSKNAADVASARSQHCLSAGRRGT